MEKIPDDVVKSIKEQMGLPSYLPIESMSESMKNTFEFGVRCYSLAQKECSEKDKEIEELEVRYESNKERGEQLLEQVTKQQQRISELEAEKERMVDIASGYDNKLTIANDEKERLKGLIKEEYVKKLVQMQYSVGNIDRFWEQFKTDNQL